MDVLTALVTLMGKQRVGRLAKEGLLVALSMRDERVDDFVTRFTAAVGHLSQTAASAGQQSLQAQAPPGLPRPHFTSHQGPSLGVAAAAFDRQLQSPPAGSAQPRPGPTPRQAEARPGALDAFARAVRLVDAVTVS